MVKIKNKMENPSSFESRELIIDKLVKYLAEREGMDSNDILSDIVTFAPYEGNDTPNPDYIEQIAEMIGISPEEMSLYAIKKAEEYLEE